MCKHCGEPYESHPIVQASIIRDSYFAGKDAISIAICPKNIYEQKSEYDVDEEDENEIELARRKWKHQVFPLNDC